MSSTRIHWLAWALFGLYGVAVLASIALTVVGEAASDEGWGLLFAGYAIVGLVVVTLDRAGVIGLLLLATATAYGLGSLAYTYVKQGDRPGQLSVAWFASWSPVVPLCLALALLPLLFPTGRPLSPRWRWAVAVSGAALVLDCLGGAFREGVLDVDTPTPTPNPLGVGGPLGTVVAVVSLFGVALTVVAVVLGAVSTVLRLRRSHGRERQQIKVFAYVAVTLVVPLSVMLTGSALDRPGGPPWAGVAADVGWLTSILLWGAGVPAAIGVAILRHRLYGIDVVIHKTLVYGTLTAALAAAYLTLVLVLRVVLGPVTGESDLAVAASTLAVAGIFRPARARIQALVDRRFYRHRYDATRTVSAFSAHLRDELDLETVVVDLRAAVQETVEPTCLTVWLRT